MYSVLRISLAVRDAAFALWPNEQGRFTKADVLSGLFMYMRGNRLILPRKENVYLQLAELTKSCVPVPTVSEGGCLVVR